VGRIGQWEGENTEVASLVLAGARSSAASLGSRSSSTSNHRLSSNGLAEYHQYSTETASRMPSNGSASTDHPSAARMFASSGRMRSYRSSASDS
jgi:hypothetical protein